jgi:hypothetical protein
MQLKPSRRPVYRSSPESLPRSPHRRPRLLFLAAIWLVASASPRVAKGASDPDAPDRPSTDSADTDDSDETTSKALRKKKKKDEESAREDERATKKKHDDKLEDVATKRATLEIAGYNDSDHVTVVTPSIALGIENVSGASLHGNYLVDVVSAASADIVSTASRRWEEVRQAGALSAEYKPHDFGVAVGGSISDEPDYLSYGVYATVTSDFDEKNWSLFFGYGFSHDRIGRCGAGGACTPFSIFSRDLQRGSFNGGVNFVIDRESLGSITADLIIENGDQSKPYRYIPLFAPEVARNVPKGASIDSVNQHRLPERPLEQLPLSRRRFAVTGRYAHRFDGSTLRLEERIYDDDWGLLASSSDGRWIFDLGQRFAVWPHVHVHVQSSVSFWQLAYESRDSPGWNLPLYRTGDRELGPLWTTGGGFGIKWYLGSDKEPRQWALQLTADGMYTSFLNDLYLTSRTAGLAALAFEGEF